MNSAIITLIVLAIGALAALALYVSRRRVSSHGTTGGKGEQTSSASTLAVSVGDETASLPAAIHYGNDLANPAVTLRPLPLSELQVVAETPVVEPSLGVASRLSALMQAAPSVLVAEAHRGRQLMEVVIDGKLMRAADGDGFRAMSRGANGIKEHARLYETKDLANLVNAAAVWQLASVIVAQKHLADISQKLGEIKDAVNSISDFLDSERRSVIQGTYQYLQQAYEALGQGELSQAIRGELESCERELLAVQNHLVGDIRRRAQIAPRDDDKFGTESLHKNSIAKYVELAKTVEDLKICLSTRVLAWYVLSLYPGEQAVKAARSKSIKEGLDVFTDLQSLVEARSSIDTELLKSMWNLDKTLVERKGEVAGEAKGVQELLESVRTDTATQLEKSQTLLLQHDAPTLLFVELVDGRVTEVRQRELIAA